MSSYNNKVYDKTKKYFFITRGIPGSGKSTFAKKYLSTISNIIESDYIRQSLVGLDENGKISQKNGNEVWEVINSILLLTLRYGSKSLTLDATNITNYQLRKYKTLADFYNYEFIIIDFSNISKEMALQQNNNRLFYKQVSQEVIEKMYKQLQKENKKLNFETFTKEQFLEWLGIKQ